MNHYRAKIYVFIFLASFVAVLCEPCKTPYQGPGTCMRIRECRELMAYLMTRPVPWSEGVQNYITSSVCSVMKDGKKTVCCPSKLIPFGEDEDDSDPGPLPDDDTPEATDY